MRLANFFESYYTHMKRYASDPTMAVSTTPPIVIPAIAPADTVLDDDVCEATAPNAVPGASEALLIIPYTVFCKKEEDDGVSVVVSGGGG